MTPITEAKEILKKLSKLWMQAAVDESFNTLNLYRAIKSLEQFIEDNK